MMKFKIPLCLAIMQAAAFAGRAQSRGGGDLVSQITAGFGEIIGGSLGLKLAVVILVVIGLAIGYWQGSAGGL